MSICLPLELFALDFIKEMADLLSQKILTGLSSIPNFKLFIKYLIQIAVLTAVLHDIYSASIVCLATQLYFLLNQETVVPSNRNTLPLIDFLLFTSPAKSASIYLMIFRLFKLKQSFIFVGPSNI